VSTNLNHLQSFDWLPSVTPYNMIYNYQGFELGVEPPPLEEFKRLMESLGPDSMFEPDDYSIDADDYVQPEPIP
jgi:hypothetical protein